MLGRPAAVTVPAAPDESAHLDAVAPTAREVVPVPVTLMAVTVDAALRLALDGLALNETVAPDVGARSVVTVATTPAFDPASARAGADTLTFTVAGVGVGLGLGVGLSLGVGLALGVGDALG